MKKKNVSIAYEAADKNRSKLEVPGSAEHTLSGPKTQARYITFLPLTSAAPSRSMPVPERS